MLWQIRSFPKCDYHVFLSHSQEDRDPLVEPTRIKLAARNVVTWFDQQDYYYGRPSRAALRDGILKSRHTVHFITDAMLGSSRGWCVMELSLVELLQGNLQVRGGQLAHPMLPLFFVSQDDRRLARSVWQDLRDQGRVSDAGTETCKRHGDHDASRCRTQIRTQKGTRSPRPHHRLSPW